MTFYAHRWRTAAFRIPRRTSATRSAVACCLAVLLALAACDQAGPAPPPPGSTAGGLPPTAAPASDPSPTAGPVPTPAPTPSPATMAAPDGRWRGLTIAAEDRCSPYDPDDYPYSQSVEPRIIAGMGSIVYGPYTGRTFSDRGETDIEHIVARSEAHDSGLCAADSQTRRRFASDLLNLTLAAPSVNRHRKVAKDAAEWLPDMNPCWFADRVVRVRQKYGLTIDRREADARLSAVGMHIGGDGVRRLSPARTDAGDETLLSERSGTVGRQRERAHHLRRGAQTWHRAGAQRTPGV